MQSFLGVIHTMDDLGDFRHRIDRCANHIADFGIATPCGTRSHPAERVLAQHQLALQTFRGCEHGPNAT
jgi:hypothetical protein